MATQPTQVHVVLFVDPDVDLHPRVMAMLPEHCAFLGARNAEAAVRLAARRAPSLLVANADMGEAALMDLVSDLRARSPGLRVVTLSSLRDPEALGRLVKLGPLIAKPIDPPKLRDAIISALRFCKMSASVDHLKSESVNVQTWSGTAGPK